MGRRLWIKVHLWLGIILGPWLALVGLTGSVVTYFYELDALLNPQFYRVTQTGRAPIPLAQVVDLARRAYPQAGPATEVKLPDSGPVAYVTLQSPDGGRPLSVWVSRPDGRVNAARPAGSELVSVCLNLHGELLAGPIGAAIVDLLGFIAIASIVTGLIVWWPRGGRWRGAFKVRWARTAWAPRIFDLHRVIGVITLVPLLLLLISGERNLTRDFSIPTSRQSQPIACADEKASPDISIGVDQAVAIALACSPGGELISVALPKEPGAPYSVRLRSPDDADIQFFGRDVLRITPSGEVLSVSRVYGGGLIDDLVDTFEPIHSGDVLGEPGRVLVVICGLLPLLFYATGFGLWLYKRRPRRAPRAPA